MTHYLASLLIGLTLLVFGYNTQASSLRTRLSDDGRTLSIQIDGNKSGQPFHLQERYDITGMNSLQKEIIKYRAFKSVGLTPPLHDMPVLILGPMGLLAFVITLFILRYQTRKRLLPPLP